MGDEVSRLLVELGLDWEPGRSEKSEEAEESGDDE